jgi:type 1 glutamine amidotransferase
MRPARFLAAAGALVLGLIGAAIGAEDHPWPPVPEDMVKKIAEAMPGKPQVTPAKPRKLLVFTLCSGARHGSIPFISKAIEILGEKTGAFTAVVSDDPAMFDAENLKQFDAVFMDNTTGNLFTVKGRELDKERNDERRKNFLEFVRSGKGLAGVHAATDCSSGWKDYGEMIGGYFAGHPYQKTIVRVESKDNPVNAAFKGMDEFPHQEETYVIKAPYSRETHRVLLGIDMEKSGLMEKSARPDGDHALAWIKRYGEGRVFYSAFGHDNKIVTDAMILRFWLDGIQYALGDLKADDSPSGKESAPPVPPPAK